MIDVRKVSKIYGKKDNTFHALTNVSLSIKAGEAMAIVGKSGSGKSTLIHILTGLDVPSTGDVKSGGQKHFPRRHRHLARSKYRDCFSAIFLQNNDTVLQNVALPLKIQGVAKKPREQAARARR